MIGVETEDSEHNYSKIKTKCIIIETRFNYNCVTINKEISIEIMEKIDKLLICRKMNSLGTDIYFEIAKLKNAANTKL